MISLGSWDICCIHIQIQHLKSWQQGPFSLLSHRASACSPCWLLISVFVTRRRQREEHAELAQTIASTLVYKNWYLDGGNNCYFVVICVSINSWKWEPETSLGFFSCQSISSSATYDATHCRQCAQCQRFSTSAEPCGAILAFHIVCRAGEAILESRCVVWEIHPGDFHTLSIHVEKTVSAAHFDSEMLSYFFTAS